MNARLTLLATAAALGLAVPPASAAVSTTSPGKNAVAVAEDEGGLDIAGNITPLQATIVKARSRRILRIEARVNVAGSSQNPGVYALVEVNGISPKPNGYSSVHCSTSGTGAECGVTATYWLDIDAAGLAGQPLEILMWGGSTSSPSNLPYAAGFTAEMIKK